MTPSTHFDIITMAIYLQDNRSEAENEYSPGFSPQWNSRLNISSLCKLQRRRAGLLNNVADANTTILVGPFSLVCNLLCRSL
jgi:hypothetical protein